MINDLKTLIDFYVSPPPQKSNSNMTGLLINLHIGHIFLTAFTYISFLEVGTKVHD